MSFHRSNAKEIYLSHFFRNFKYIFLIVGETGTDCHTELIIKSL